MQPDGLVGDEFGLPEKVAYGDDEAIARLDRMFRIALDCYDLGGRGLKAIAYTLFERLSRVEGDGVPPGLLVVSRRMEKILHPDTHPTVAAIHALDFFQPRIVRIRRADDPEESEPDAGT
ncbi:MAG: hypothetical protein U0871_07155 [Gemmataceae bacterium]